MPDRPDHRLEARLDDRIRDLVARAVASAPLPPEIDTSAVVVAGHEGGRPSRWWLAAAGVALIAVVSGAIVLAPDGDETVGPTQSDPTSTPTPDPVTNRDPVEGWIVIVTPEGVEARDASTGEEIASISADEIPWLRSPTYAVAVGDGRVVVGDDRYFVTWDTSSGEFTDLFPAADLAGSARAHDVAVIDGRPWLLYTIQPQARETALLLVVPLAERRGDRALGRNGVEIAPSVAAGRLSLASNGLVVGADPARGVWTEVYAVPGAPAETELADRTATDLGLPQEPTRCAGPTVCQFAVAVSPDGQRAALARGSDLSTQPIWEPEDPTRTIDLGFIAEHIDVLPDGSILVTPDRDAGATGPIRRIDTDGIVLEEYPGAIAVTEGPSRTASSVVEAPAPTPTVVSPITEPLVPNPPTAGPTVEPTNVPATATPTVAPVTTPSVPAATSTPPELMTTVPTPASTSDPTGPQPGDAAQVHPMIAVVTADGVSARDPSTGQEIAAISPDQIGSLGAFTGAVAAGDGRVVIGDGTYIEVWDTATGEVVDFFGPGGSLAGPARVHDAAIIDGRPWVLYSVQPEERDAEVGVRVLGGRDEESWSGEYRSVGEVAPEIAAAHLSLGANGLVVGVERGPVPRHYVAAVPGTEAVQLISRQTASELGLPPLGHACFAAGECSIAATVDPAGETVAWIDDGQLSLQSLGPLATPETRDLGLGVTDPIEHIDLLPDESVLVIPDADASDSAGPIRRVATDGTVLEEYPGAIAVTEGPSRIASSMVVEPGPAPTLPSVITDVPQTTPPPTPSSTPS